MAYEDTKIGNIKSSKKSLFWTTLIFYIWFNIMAFSKLGYNETFSLSQFKSSLIGSPAMSGTFENKLL